MRKHIEGFQKVEGVDLLEASVEDGKISFTPKVVLDRHLAEAPEDVRDGRFHGPNETAQRAINALEATNGKH